MTKTKIEPVEQVEALKSLDKVLDYLWGDEESNFEAWKGDHPGEDLNQHIYTHVLRVNTWAEKLRQMKVPKERFLMQHDSLLLEALMDLNMLYGKGRITWVDFREQQVNCELQYGNETARFKTENGFVWFKGHKRQFFK